MLKEELVKTDSKFHGRLRAESLTLTNILVKPFFMSISFTSGCIFIFDVNIHECSHWKGCNISGSNRRFAGRAKRRLSPNSARPLGRAVLGLSHPVGFFTKGFYACVI